MNSQTAAGPVYRTALQRILREDGRRQDWLAEQVGISQSRLSLIVNGLHCPEPLKEKIAAALRREISEVFPA
jgi:DNA-binding XRE family transcriptional regulator